MTLSYVGQLLDELSILWTVAVAYAFWYPRVYYPRCIKSRYDSEGQRVAGSEGRDGTLTLMRVTHRSPPSPQPAPLQGVSIEVTAVCFGTRPSITQWWMYWQRKSKKPSHRERLCWAPVDWSCLSLRSCRGNFAQRI